MSYLIGFLMYYWMRRHSFLSHPLLDVKNVDDDFEINELVENRRDLTMLAIQILHLNVEVILHPDDLQILKQKILLNKLVLKTERRSR